MEPECLVSRLPCSEQPLCLHTGPVTENVLFAAPVKTSFLLPTSCTLSESWGTLTQKIKQDYLNGQVNAQDLTEKRQSLQCWGLWCKLLFCSSSGSSSPVLGCLDLDIRKGKLCKQTFVFYQQRKHCDLAYESSKEHAKYRETGLEQVHNFSLCIPQGAGFIFSQELPSQW